MNVETEPQRPRYVVIDRDAVALSQENIDMLIWFGMLEECDRDDIGAVTKATNAWLSFTLNRTIPARPKGTH